MFYEVFLDDTKLICWKYSTWDDICTENIRALINFIDIELADMWRAILFILTLCYICTEGKRHWVYCICTFFVKLSICRKLNCVKPDCKSPTGSQEALNTSRHLDINTSRKFLKIFKLALKRSINKDKEVKGRRFL